MAANVGGFQFVKQAGKRAREPEPQRRSLGRKAASPLIDAAAAAAVDESASGLDGGALRSVAQSALAADGAPATADRIANAFRAVFSSAEAYVEDAHAASTEHVRAAHAAFVTHLMSELAKELPVLSTANPKNVDNARVKAQCEKRIAEYGTELAHWQGLAEKVGKATETPGPATEAAGADAAVAEWTAGRGKAGRRVLSAVESATSQALQDLDSVASAMRAGGRAVKAAKRAVEDASREARKTAQAAAGGKDAKSILKSIILR